MEEIEEKILQIAQNIEFIGEDTSVPRNIRRAKNSLDKWLLNRSKDLDVRIATTQTTLQELCDDPNIPMHASTMIFNILAQLETLLATLKK